MDKDMDAESLQAPSKVETDKAKNLEPRGQWSGRLDFIVSCLGYAVGKTLIPRIW